MIHKAPPSNRYLLGFIVVLLCVIFYGCGEEPKALPEGSELALSQGWKIHYLEQGPQDGPVVLFVHGLGGSSEYWKQTLASPEMKKYRSLAIDLLGFGRSDKPKEFDYSLEKQAEIIREFLALKKINKVIYVGHSMGGSVGIALARLQADLLEKLVLVDSTLHKDYAGAETLKLAGWGEFKFRLVFPLLKIRAEKITAASFEAPPEETIKMASRIMKESTSYSFHRSLVGTVRLLEKREFLDSFKGIKIPHYYIYGTTDAGVARMAKEQFGSEPWVHPIQGVRHCPMVEAPDHFNSALGKVLAE